MDPAHDRPRFRRHRGHNTAHSLILSAHAAWRLVAGGGIGGRPRAGERLGMGTSGIVCYARPREVERVAALPHFSTLIVLSSLGALAFTIWITRRPRDGHRRCGRCRYIIDGLPGHICPECGSDLAIAGIREPWLSTPGSLRAMRAWIALAWFLPAVLLQNLADEIRDDFLSQRRIYETIRWQGDEFRHEGTGVRLCVLRGYRESNLVKPLAAADLIVVEFLPSGVASGHGWLTVDELTSDPSICAVIWQIADGKIISRARVGDAVQVVTVPDWRPMLAAWLSTALDTSSDQRLMLDFRELLADASKRELNELLDDAFGFERAATWSTTGSLSTYASATGDWLQWLAFIFQHSLSIYVMASIGIELWITIRKKPAPQSPNTPRPS